MGMKEWFAPQISEHWPNRRPGRLTVNCDWLIRPGLASTLIPADGSAQEWITSCEEISSRIALDVGIATWGSATISRAMEEGFKKLSISWKCPGIS